MFCILLIGLQEDDAIRRGFHQVANLFPSCATLEGAKPLMKDVNLFLLDGRFGLDACASFLRWTAEHSSAIGIILEDTKCSAMCIAAINSGIICDYLIRPVTSQQYREAYDKYRRLLLKSSPADG